MMSPPCPGRSCLRFALCLWVMLTLLNGRSLQAQSKNSFYNKQDWKPTYNGVSPYPIYLPYSWWIRWINFQNRQKLEQQSRRKPAPTMATATTTIRPTKLSQANITALIKAALENGELLYPDEWMKRWNATHGIWLQGRENESLPTTNPNGGTNEDNLEVSHGAAPVCEGSTFCEDAPDYPDQLMNLAIQRNDSLRLLANEDRISNVSVRMNDDAEESPLCGMYTYVVYPKSAEGVDGNWLFVINQKNFRQGVRVGICIEENSNCGGIDDYLPGVTIRCKQHFIQRELVAMKPDGTFNKHTFNFPASCCCSMYRKYIF